MGGARFVCKVEKGTDGFDAKFAAEPQKRMAYGGRWGEGTTAIERR
jgi:hypothetical protein